MNTEIATIAAAWFGAVGTVVLTVLEIYKYWRDKPRLIITCDFNQEIVDDDGTRDEIQGDCWSINVANDGSKPIIIASINVETHKGKNLQIARDSAGQRFTKQTLPVGDSIHLVISEKLALSKNLKNILVVSGIGKHIRKRFYFWQKK